MRPDDVERRASRCSAAGRAPTCRRSTRRTVQAPKATTLVLIDKPGAAQSSFRLGGIGVPRSTRRLLRAPGAEHDPRRIVHEPAQPEPARDARLHVRRGLRLLDAPRSAGPFTASAEVVSAKTDSALIEFMKELRAIRDTVPSDELAKAKRYLQLGLPEDFETTGASPARCSRSSPTASRSTSTTRQSQKIGAVTQADVQRVARQYVNPDRLTIVIVGDRKMIEPGLRALKPGEIIIRDVRDVLGRAADEVTADWAVRAGRKRRAPRTGQRYGVPFSFVRSFNRRARSCRSGTNLTLDRAQFHPHGNSDRDLHAAQRTLRDPLRGSHGANRRREPLVSRRLGERARRAAPASRTCSSTCSSRARRDVGANEHFELVQRAGGTLNGSTWLDRTNYFETRAVEPARARALARGESHGLAAAGDDAAEARHAARRRAERAALVDGQPAVRHAGGRSCRRSAFPTEHPFHHSLIGSMEDLDAASLEDVAQFFATYYTPDNAVLSIAGDFDRGEARAMVERHFGPIPRGAGKPPLPDMTLPPVFGAVAARGGARRRDAAAAVPRASARRRSAATSTTRRASRGAILGLRKGSRLHRALVREQQVAAEAPAFTYDLDEGQRPARRRRDGAARRSSARAARAGGRMRDRPLVARRRDDGRSGARRRADRDRVRRRRCSRPATAPTGSRCSRRTSATRNW